VTRPNWTTVDADVAAFLDDFDANGRLSPEPGRGPADLFADSFLALDPVRAVTLTPGVLAAALPARRRMFDEAGVGEIRRIDASQLRLDDWHTIVSASWSAARANAADLQLKSSFLLRRTADGYEIVVYLNHTDVATALAGSS
jgi:hypothetical protein